MMPRMSKANTKKRKRKSPELVELGLGECSCCGRPSAFTILLVDGGSGHYYIPNQHVRACVGTGISELKQIPFCHPCMRAIEDNLRATIAMLVEYSRPDEDEDIGGRVFVRASANRDD